jgi:hypothetical protein
MRVHYRPLLGVSTFSEQFSHDRQLAFLMLIREDAWLVLMIKGLNYVINKDFDPSIIEDKHEKRQAGADNADCYASRNRLTASFQDNCANS